MCCLNSTTNSSLIVLLIVAFAVSAGSAEQAAGVDSREASRNNPALGESPKPAMNNGQDAKSKAARYEDLSLLPLTPGMHATEPLLGEETKQPGFTRELLQLQWRPNDPLDLWVIRPTGVEKPPVILYLYSFPSDTTRYYDLEFCKSLTDHRFAAVGFVSALTGHRYHDRPQKKWFISELQESLGSSVHDVQMILNYLASRGDLDMNRVGMWGDGSGASIAIMAATVDPRIKALDLLDPWGDWPDWLAKSTLIPENERADYLKPEFLGKVANLDPVKWLLQLKTQQIRLQYIENGVTVTPKAAKQRLEASAGPNVQLVRYRDAQEFFKEVASTGKGFDWIKGQLGARAADPTTAIKKKTHSDGAGLAAKPGRDVAETKPPAESKRSDQ